MDIRDLYNFKLVRKADGFYSLGDEQLDKAFGLDQNTYVSAPSQSTVENFTALAYIYGIMGYKASNFTACPTGFIVTFKKGKKFATFNTNENFVEFNRKYIINDLKSFSSSNELNLFEQLMCGYLAEHISNLLQPLLKSCIILNSKLETAKNQSPVLKENRDQAIQPFDFISTMPNISLNYTNCENNHILLKKMCRSILGLNVNGKNLTEEQKKQVEELYNKVLFKTILRFYKHHVGFRKQNKDGQTITVPVRRDFEVLSRPETVKELLDLVKTRGNLGLVTTIAATDFNADVVFDALKILTKCSNVEECEKDLKKIIPDTPYSTEHDKNIRDIISYWTRNNQGPHKVR